MPDVRYIEGAIVDGNMVVRCADRRCTICYPPGSEARANLDNRDELDKDRFMASLTDDQRLQLASRRTITVVGNLGTHYLLCCASGYIGNVWWFADDVDLATIEATSYPPQMVGSACCYPASPSTVYGAWLVQKLALETDETNFLAIACVSGNYPTTINKDELIAAQRTRRGLLRR